MTKNLDTADTVVKLVLSAAIIVFYATGVLVGPFAQFLVVLSATAIVLTVLRRVISPRK